MSISIFRSRRSDLLKILLGFLFAQFHVSFVLSDDAVFTALFPKIIRPHESYDLHLSVEPLADNDQSPVTFEITVTPDPQGAADDPDDNFLNRKRSVRSLTLGEPAVNDKPPVPIIKPPPVVPSSPETIPGNAKLVPVISEEIMIVPGQTNSIKMNFGDLSQSIYNLTIKATNSENTIFATDSALLHVERKEESAVIQTDKPIYKPGETVMFRVLFLDRHLRPSSLSSSEVPTRSITIKVLDSSKNVIRIWNQVQLDGTYSYVKKSMELSPEPNLGDWNIQVEVEAKDNGTSKVVDTYHQSFKVDQYVLPKFKVDVKPNPPFVTFEESKFILTINAMYTYGKPVTSGTCTVELYAEYDYYLEDEDTNNQAESDYDVLGGGSPTVPSPRKQRKVVKTLEISGENHLDFDLKSDLKIRSDDANDYGKEYLIKASCTEGVSGKVQNASSSIKLYEHPYKITVVDPPESYKPGFPLTMTIKVSCQSDFPISDNRPDALRIDHGFSYDSEGGVITKPIPPSGLVTVTFTTPTNEYIYISSFDVTYKNLTQFISVPSKEQSPTKTYMQISTVMTTTRRQSEADNNNDGDGSAEGEGGNQDNSSSSKGLFKVGDTVPINVRMNKGFDNLHYIVASRGQILVKERVSFTKKNMEQIITLKIPQTIVPQVTLIVYTIIGTKNEVIADDISLDVLVGSNNVVKISLSSSLSSSSSGDDETAITTSPGSSINVICEGSPQSLIAVRAVDQSVLLLTEDTDLTKASLKRTQDSFDVGIGNFRIYGGSETFQTFDKTGVLILTNAMMMKQREYRPLYRGGFRLAAFNAAPVAMMSKVGRVEMEIMEDDAGVADGAIGAPLMSSNEFYREPVKVRINFPETWIFKEIETVGDGKAELNEIVPDTITSWMINAFQISPDEGIGLSESPAKLTVFRPFFISLNLPYSIVQGEVVSLQVLVHNYLPEATKAKIILDNSRGELNLLEFPNSTAGRDEIWKEIEVQGSSVSTVSFLVSTNKIGTITLDLKGLVMSAGDAVSQPLIVRPPGVKHVRNSVVYFNFVENRMEAKEMVAVFPKKRVNGGDSIKVSVLGDVLGGTIHNLESLIHLPTGCGEQNMLNFVPDIVALDYLKVTEQLQPDVRTKALRFLEIGYQRELTYRRTDGSFSAFGQSDPGGSTWLTAFVVKSFISAKRYIHIDEDIIQSSLEFLTIQQTENGSFVEEGKIIHLGMQGATSDNPHALTAYCLIAFTEAQQDSEISDKFKSIVDKGIKWLLKEFDRGSVSKNSYTINLISYLLHLLDHPRQNDLYRAMEDHAKFDVDSELKYWQIHERVTGPAGQSSNNKLPQLFWNPSEPTFAPASIEMTSYALLTQLIRDKRSNSNNNKNGGGMVSKVSISIARWLMKQRNENGGFLSTQDTVVGITALSQFAQETRISSKSKYKMRITASWLNEVKSEKGSHDFFIGPENTTVLQEFILGNGVKKVNVNANGIGTALAQVTWTYYTLLSPNSTAFFLSVKVVGKDQNRRLEMYICTSYLLNNSSSNMALLEVNTPTGYTFDPEELIAMKKSNHLIKRHELEDKDTKLNIYFSSLKSTRVCLTLTSYRVFLVAKHSKASVAIFDYYDTTKRTQRFYDPPTIDSCSICKSEATCKLYNCL